MGNSALKTEIIEIEEGTDTFRIVRCPDNRPADDILKRFAAELIDGAIIGFFFFITQLFTITLCGKIFHFFNINKFMSIDKIYLITFSATYLFVKCSYYYILYRQKCTTFGKKFFHFRVYRTNTQEPIGILRILIREVFGKAITIIFLPISFLWYLLDSKSRLPHDLLSGTMTVEELKEHNGIDY